MREIKFRAWDKDLKQMFPVWKLDLTVEPSATVKEYDGDGYCERRIKSHYVMQYTGLKDKNGKEIYEGDVVSWGKGQSTLTGKVYYEGNRFMVENFYMSSFDETADALGEGLGMLQIIGNIYENPELLK